MSDFNQFICMGAIVTDPEKRQTKNGKDFARFRFGYNRGWGDQKQQCYVTVLCWGKLGESILDWGKKGKRYLLIGDLSVVDNRTQDGYSTSVFVNAVNMRPLSFEKEDDSSSYKSKNTDPLEDTYGSGDSNDDSEEEEDIPF